MIIKIKNKDTLIIDEFKLKCSIGKNGISKNKFEGDLSSPKGKFGLGKAFGKGVPAVFAGSTLASLAIQKAMGDVGGREPGESLTAFNKRRESTVSNYLAYYFKRANKFRKVMSRSLIYLVKSWEK